MTATFRRRDDIVARQIAGETILVPIRGELAQLHRVFVLDNVSEHIWSFLDGQHELSAIADSIVRQFEVDLPTAEADLNEFLGQLRAADLVDELECGGGR